MIMMLLLPGDLNVNKKTLVCYMSKTLLEKVFYFLLQSVIFFMLDYEQILMHLHHRIMKRKSFSLSIDVFISCGLSGNEGTIPASCKAFLSAFFCVTSSLTSGSHLDPIFLLVSCSKFPLEENMHDLCRRVSK